MRKKGNLEPFQIVTLKQCTDVTMLQDHVLVQIVDVPTHQGGHILDWVVMHSNVSCLSLTNVKVTTRPSFPPYQLSGRLRPSNLLCHITWGLLIPSASCLMSRPWLRVPSSVLSQSWWLSAAMTFVRSWTAMPPWPAWQKQRGRMPLESHPAHCSHTNICHRVRCCQGCFEISQETTLITLILIFHW